MKIKIEIENCETISDFYSHLSELRRQIKKQARKRKLNPLKDEFKRSDSIFFEDANCYGEHYVTIINERI